MACCFRTVQYLITFILVGAIGLAAAACAVDYWVKSKYSHGGLWKGCHSTLCITRDDIFKFDKNKNFDIVLAALAIGGATYIFSLVLILVTICQRFPSKCLVLIETMCSFLGAGFCTFGCVWYLQEITKDNLGWTAYVAFGSCGAGFIAMLLSIVLLCSHAPGAYHTTRRDDEIVMLSR